MKKAIVIFIVLILSLLYHVGFLTEKETLPFSKEFFSVETPPSDNGPLDLKEVLSLKSQGGDKKTPAKSAKELNQLYQLKLDKGIRNLPILSYLLSREASKARSRRDSDQAITLATYAVKFSPDLPQFYFERAKALWYQSPLQLHKVLPEFFNGLVKQFRYYPSSLKSYYNFFYIVCNAILMTFIVFGIIMMAKYLPLYFYDMRRDVSMTVSGLILTSMKMFVLLIPFLLRLDILWAIMFWSIFLWGYARKKERQIILISFILLVYLPFFLGAAGSFLDGPQSEVILGMNQANYESWDKTVEQKLQDWSSAHPDDTEVLFTLGLIEKREGRFGQAEQWYRKSIQQAPQFHEALSNLGNVYLANKQPDLAIAFYQQAVDLNPNKGAYYYNLYRAYSQETFLMGKTSKAFERARQLDPKLVDYYLAIDSSNINRMAIDEVLTARRLWKRFLNQFIGSEGILYRLFKAWFEKIPSRVFLVPLFFLGFLIGISRHAYRKRYLNRCPMCGSPTYRFYLGASEEESICFNCHRLFILREKMHPKIKEKKSRQVHQFQKSNHFTSKVLSFIFVGFSDLWGGQPFKGLLFLLMLFVFIFRFVNWNGVLMLPMPQSSPTLLRWIFWVGLFVLFYVLSFRRVTRLKPKYEIER